MIARHSRLSPLSFKMSHGSNNSGYDVKEVLCLLERVAVPWGRGENIRGRKGSIQSTWVLTSL